MESRREAEASDGARPTVRHKPRPRARVLTRDLTVRLSRAEGQLRGIRKMLGESAYCIDVLQQLAAARRALDKIALLLLRDHLESCVGEALGGPGAAAKINELIETLDRYLA